MEQKYRRTIRILMSVVLIITGITLLSIFVDCKDQIWQVVVFNIGVALVVAGIVAIFNELLFGKDNEKALSEGSKQQEGLRIIAEKRQRFPGYYNWVLDSSPKTLKFSGHAVLKSMEDGYWKGKRSDFVDVLFNEIKNGSKIYVLFFDPEWKMVETVTTDMANANKKVLYERLSAALSITKMLYSKIESSLSQSISINGELKINLVRVANNQYAYHYVEYEDNRKEVFVGFYFSGKLGDDSPVYIINGNKDLENFDRSFDHLCKTSTCLLSFENGFPILSKRFDETNKYVNEKLRL